MKRGIEMSWAYDYKGRLALRIEKKRGKLTLAEIQDLIMYEERQAESLVCWGIPLSHLGMVERDAAEHDGAIVVDNCRLLWDDDTEAIAVEAVRKAKSGWAKAWERAVWEALEGVDLHKEEDT